MSERESPAAGSDRLIGEPPPRVGRREIEKVSDHAVLREASHIRNVHLLFIALMLMAGLLWGFKLEWRIDETNTVARANDSRVSEIERQVNRGILPLAEERLKKNATRIEQVVSDHRNLELKLEGLAAAMERLKTEEAQNQLIIERLRSDQADRLRKRVGP